MSTRKWKNVFADAREDLVQGLKHVVPKCTRVVIFVAAQTSTVAANRSYLDTVKAIWDLYGSGESHEVGKYKFRAVILVMQRFELLDKLQKHVDQLWTNPKEIAQLVVQLQRRAKHSCSFKPYYALVLGPPSDFSSSEPCQVLLPKAIAKQVVAQGVLSKCTNPSCPLRGSSGVQDDEIHKDDRVADVLAAMSAELA